MRGAIAAGSHNSLAKPRPTAPWLLPTGAGYGFSGEPGLCSSSLIRFLDLFGLVERNSTSGARRMCRRSTNSCRTNPFAACKPFSVFPRSSSVPATWTKIRIVAHARRKAHFRDRHVGRRYRARILSSPASISSTSFRISSATCSTR